MSEIKLFERDERGLVKGVEYKFLEDGTVDWRGMLKPEHLYVAKEKIPAIEKKYGKSISQIDKTTLADNELAILLSGIRYLANLRGYVKVEQTVNDVTFDNHYNLVSSCTATCSITWRGNFETNLQETTYSDVAGASLGNLEEFVKRYPESMAANRAFQRAVRGFLGISIVAKDECGPQEPIQPKQVEYKSSSLDPIKMLEDKMSHMGLDFPKLKENIIKKYSDNFKDAANWKDIQSVEKNDIFTLLGILEKASKKV